MFDNLPDEVVLAIAWHLCGASLHQLSLCSTRLFNLLSEEEALWTSVCWSEFRMAPRGGCPARLYYLGVLAPYPGLWDGSYRSVVSFVFCDFLGRYLSTILHLQARRGPGIPQADKEWRAFPDSAGRVILHRGHASGPYGPDRVRHLLRRVLAGRFAAHDLPSVTRGQAMSGSRTDNCGRRRPRGFVPSRTNATEKKLGEVHSAVVEHPRTFHSYEPAVALLRSSACASTI